MVTLAAEYPNDNSALHCGVIWVCRTPTGRPEPELPELVVEELQPLDASVCIETVPPLPVPEASGVLPVATLSSVLPPAPTDAFTVFVCTLVDVAIRAGAPSVAAMLPALLHEGRIDGIDERLASALTARGIRTGEHVAPGFVAVTDAWRAILRGTSENFEACGGTTLDQWAADLLAGLLGRSATGLRAELRAHGVAAFGLVDAAA